MKKITKYIFSFIFILIGVFCLNNYIALAEGEDADDEVVEEPVIYNDDLAVINPNSDGDPTYKMDDVQYTRVRDITVLIKLDISEYHPQKYSVCEYVEANAEAGISESERCSTYPTAEKEVMYQIASPDDGKKIIKIKFYDKDNINSVANEVVKKIVLDTIGPVITLKDGDYLFLKQGQKYQEPGATCVDNSGYVEGTCEVIYPENVNIDMNSTEYQYLNYTAIDFLGNQTNVTRKILVETLEKEADYTYWYIGIGGVVILAAFLFIKVWKNKEKQKNQSVL